MFLGRIWIFFTTLSLGSVLLSSCKTVPDALQSSVTDKDLRFTSTPGAYTTTAYPTFQFSFTREGYSRFECSEEQVGSTATAFATCTTPYTWTTVPAQGGTYRLYVRVIKGTSTVIETIEHVFTYDNDWTQFDGTTPSAVPPTVTYNGFSNCEAASSTCTYFSVNNTTTTWTITNPSINETAHEMGYKVGGAASSSSISNWQAFTNTITVTLPSTNNTNVHFYFRDKAGNVSDVRTSPVRVDTVAPQTEIFNNSFLPAGIVMRVNANHIKDGDFIQFDTMPTAHGNLKTILNEDDDSLTFNAATLAICSGSDASGVALDRLDCRFEFDNNGDCDESGATPHCIEYASALSDTNPNYALATLIATSVNRVQSANSATGGLNAPYGTNNPKGIRAYAIRDTVIFVPTHHLVAVDPVNYDYGNKFSIFVSNGDDETNAANHIRYASGKDTQQALVIGDYAPTRIYFLNSAKPDNNDQFIINDSSGQAQVIFCDTDNGCAQTQSSVDYSTSPATLRVVFADTSDSSKTVAQRTYNLITSYFQNHPTTTTRNSMTAHLIENPINDVNQPVTAFEVRLFRTDGSNTPISITSVTNAGSGFTIFPVVPVDYDQFGFHHVLQAGQATAALGSVPKYGPTSKSLDGAINDFRTCESWGNLNFPGSIEDGLPSPSASMKVLYRIKKISNRAVNGSLTPATGTVCFNGKYDNTANMNAGCTSFQEMDPVRTSNASTFGSQKWDFNIAVPKCALARGGSGIYQVEVKGKDLAGNLDPTPSSFTFEWDSSTPLSGPASLVAAPVPGLNWVSLVPVQSSTLQESIANLNLLIIRRNRPCDATVGQIFCGDEFPKQGVLYSKSDANPNLRNVGGAIVAYYGPANVTEIFDQNLSPGATYYYRAFYVDAYGNYSTAQDVEVETESGLQCTHGDEILLDTFDRDDSITPGFPVEGNENLFWVEFDEELDFLFGGLLGSFTNLTNNFLTFDPRYGDVGARDGIDFPGQAYIDLDPVLTGSGYPSYEVHFTIAPSEALTGATGIELQVFSHINTQNGFSMPLHYSFYDPTSDDFSDGTNSPELGIAPTLVYSPHVMGYFSVNPALNGQCQMGISYFNDEGLDASGAQLSDGYHGFRSTLAAGSCDNVANDATEIAPHTGAVAEIDTNIFYRVSLRVHVTPDGLSSRDYVGADPNVQEAYSATKWPFAQYVVDDGNIIPDMQVSFEIKRYKVSADGEIVNNIGTVTNLPTGDVSLRTLAIDEDGRAYTDFDCRIFDDGGVRFDDTDMVNEIEADGENTQCPPGTRFDVNGVINSQSNATVDAANNDREEQGAFFGPMFTGTGIGIRARLRGATDTTVVPSLNIQQVKACETTDAFPTQLDAWRDF